jgi:hypothetical protein
MALSPLLDLLRSVSADPLLLRRVLGLERVAEVLHLEHLTNPLELAWSPSAASRVRGLR